jgi:hypothetical protein
MTRKELLKIPGLGALVESLDKLPSPPCALECPAQGPAHLASPGEVWRVVSAPLEDESDCSATNPRCSTVLILKCEDELGDNSKKLAIFRVAPVLADIRFCGVEDAIFPREVFGYEAAVALGCEFTLTSRELDHCDGVLPDKWFDQLADFAAWMEAVEGQQVPAFPLLLKTGRPFTHAEDPGYIFHANLAKNLQPLMKTVLDELWAEGRDPAPTVLEWIQFSLSSFFAEHNPLCVAGSVDALTGVNQYTIKTPFGEAKLDVFAQREQPGTKARVVFRVHSPGEHLPLHILWQRKKPTGELIGDPVMLAFGESQQKLEHRLDLQADDELWAFAYHSNPTETV